MNSKHSADIERIKTDIKNKRLNLFEQVKYLKDWESDFHKTKGNFYTDLEERTLNWVITERDKLISYLNDNEPLEKLDSIRKELEELGSIKEQLECLYNHKALRLHIDSFSHSPGYKINAERLFKFIIDEIEKFENLEKLNQKEQWAEVPINQNGIRSDKRFKHPQQMLLLERLGIIKYLDRFHLTNENKALLISLFIGKNHQNTREFLISMAKKTHKKTCNTKENNDLIDQLFSKLGISDPL